MKAVTSTLLFFLLSASLFASQNRKTLMLRLESPTGNSASTTMYFDDGINAAYDVNQDVKMVFSNVPDIPEIYSYTSDKVACSTNGCGTLQTTTQVFLGYNVGYAGIYTISASLVDNFNPTTIIQLFDFQTGNVIDLRENFYQVQLDSINTGATRFMLQFTSPTVYSSTPSNCSNTGGTITITPDSSITWDVCQLIDSAGQVLKTDSNVSGQITFTGLAAGTYKVVYTYGQYTAENTFFLNGNYVTASIAPPAQPIFTNQPVIFNALTTNAVFYDWDFGDSTLITGVEHPTQTYFEPGTYTVYLSTYNEQGCSATATTTVSVQSIPAGINNQKITEATVTTQGKNVLVNMNDIAIGSGARISVFNLLGQEIAATPIIAQTETISLQQQATGYYLVAIRNSGTLNTRRVFISN